ncbi:MAG: dihydrodipicolinate synthase family protein [Kiloniellales bacterium]
MHCSGLWPPAATPLAADFGIDRRALLTHCQAMLAEGADGLAILGTTSEANSLSLGERIALIEALIEGGVEARRLLPGTGACAVPDAVEMSRQAMRAGCAGTLLLPPFFYKNVPDAGLFDYVSQVVDGVGDNRLRIYLYHIPQMAGAGWSLDLIGRLRDAFPEVVVGLKDSSGDWNNTRAIIEAFPGFAVFPASESILSEAIPLGAAGCISATANVNAGGIAALIAALRAGREALTAQADATAIREAVSAFPLVPAVKAVLAARYGNAGWCRVRAPLRPLDDAEARRLLAAPALADLLDRAA